MSAENLFTKQNWIRDADKPCVSLGEPGAFDDMHLFAPAASVQYGKTYLYYCGSQGEVEERVFRMGLNVSDDGRRFTRHLWTPVLEMGSGASVLTPTFLRSGDGTVLREGGELRLWFSSTTFPPGIVHTIHETSSRDGVTWTSPSEAQVEGAYAPTVIKDGDRYLMWYADVTVDPWIFRFAESADGISWESHPEAVIVADQPWEADRLFYPTVLTRDGVYMMWYGSYQARDRHMTAIGFAISEDGIHWTKHPENPVFEPNPEREWESHYTTSQSIHTQPDGSLRLYYASRTKPPFTHKYFAIGTAVWEKPFD
ncbi:MAG: hypothetical protein CME19_03310 [Gemmatimonadetes bacterium]|nr:hypothetical protein [Gemmatimonadota bacterium]|tara:strand:+ start:1157 stop:2092 length:936 start_codon:yes stop_codon:yes gene_type:complete